MNSKRYLRQSKTGWFLKTFAFLFISSVISGAWYNNARADEGGWEFGAELYLWYSAIDGGTSSGTSLDIDANDLVDDLNMAFMGSFEVRKNRWSFLIDGLYLDASDNQDLLLLNTGVNLNVKLEGWVVTPLIGYQAVDSDNLSVRVVAGARYLWLKTDLDLRNADPASTSFSRNVSESGNNWDAVIGLKGDVPLGTSWFIPYYLDIGTGNSNLTWQAFAGLGYHFKWCDVIVGYRYLSWDFDDDAALDDLALSGVGAGIKFNF